MKIDYDYKSRVLGIKDIETKELSTYRQEHLKLCTTSVFMQVDSELSYYVDFFFNEAIEILSSNAGNSLIELTQSKNTVFAVYQSDSAYSDNLIIQRIYYINTLVDVINRVLSKKPELQIYCAIVANTATILNKKSPYLIHTLTESMKIANQIISDNLEPIAINSLVFESYLQVKKNRVEIQDWFTVLELETSTPFYNGSVIIAKFESWIEEEFK